MHVKNYINITPKGLVILYLYVNTLLYSIKFVMTLFIYRVRYYNRKMHLICASKNLYRKKRKGGVCVVRTVFDRNITQQHTHTKKRTSLYNML
jgi:hypothetical protein